MKAQELIQVALDLGFVVDRYPASHVGFSVDIPGGSLSVIWHEGSYSGGRHADVGPRNTTTVELWDGRTNETQGYVDAAYVAATLGKLAPR